MTSTQDVPSCKQKIKKKSENICRILIVKRTCSYEDQICKRKNLGVCY